MSAPKLIVNKITIIFLLFTVGYLLLATPIQAITINSEEQAVYNLNQNLLAPEAVKDKLPNQDLVSQILSGIGNFFSELVSKAGQTLNIEKFFVQSETIQQTQTPPDVKLQGTPIEQLKSFLRGPTGVYGTDLPTLPGVEKVKDYEETYQQANFPEGVKPVTEQ
ncbi:MAG: hypothetical protein HYW45_01925 [Candidatus Daviesbacteria bacterium]|nr:MAG: hypothetical protein HYW45_01925 [Candidatus Daviesbacteria bacterium]